MAPGLRDRLGTWSGLARSICIVWLLALIKRVRVSTLKSRKRESEKARAGGWLNSWG
jgi:hypothetical protein